MQEQEPARAGHDRQTGHALSSDCPLREETSCGDDQFARVHAAGMHVWLHTCGDVWDIIPDFIEIGVDILELLQPDLFGIERLAEAFGGKVCFCCSVDHQRLACTGTRDEILGYARRLNDHLGAYDGGFMAYIPLAYHSENTELGGQPSTTGVQDVREIAIGRLALDNFDHVKSFWIMQGIKLAQVSLSFGADDLDGTVVEERITHAAGATTPQSLTRDELCTLIREAGRVPVERDTVYNVVSHR